MKSFVVAAVAVLVGLAMTVSSHAVTYGFYQLTANGTVDVSSQLTLDVTAVDLDTVLFELSNTGSIASSITDVYIDDAGQFNGSLFDDSDLVLMSGVDFSVGANPGNLPSGNTATPPFVVSVGLSTDSNPPAQSNGVNPNEKLGFTVDLMNGVTWAQVISGFDSGDIRVGLHVQAIGTAGQSEAYINTVRTNVPDGSLTVSLLGLGLAGLAMARRMIRS